MKDVSTTLLVFLYASAYLEEWCAYENLTLEKFELIYELVRKIVDKRIS